MSSKAKILNFKALAERNFAFASDNMAGIHPEVLEYIQESNHGFAAAYHTDAISVETFKLLLTKLGFNQTEAAIAWAPTGTAANVLALSHLSRPGTSVVCANQAHITTDEAGSPEVIAGLKIKEVPTKDGKLNPGDPAQKHVFDLIVADIGVERRAQPTILSISQTTEMGTVYTLEEMRKLRDYCHAQPKPWIFHLDGARISNAAVHLGVPLHELVQYADVLSFGFSKNGAMDCEAVVFRKSDQVEFKSLVKSHMCIVSKSRFIAAQACAMLDNDLWHRTASSANAKCATLLRELRRIGLITDENLVVPSQGNAIIVRLHQDVIEDLRQQFEFYTWLEGPVYKEVRFMTSWQTTDQDVNDFVAYAESVINLHKKGQRCQAHTRRYKLR